MKGPKSVDVSINLPFGLGGLKGTWEPDESERKAAWEMYVELVTRIAAVDLGPNEGLLREALASLYAMFGITRGILREYGPQVAQPKGRGDYSFGQLAVLILNQVLRPVLSKWHPLLMDHESHRPEGISAAEHERSWALAAELRVVVQDVRVTLGEYADVLTNVAGVPSLFSRQR